MIHKLSSPIQFQNADPQPKQTTQMRQAKFFSGRNVPAPQRAKITTKKSGNKTMTSPFYNKHLLLL